MFFGGLKTIKYNINRQLANIKLFEFGKTYKKLKGQYVEEEKMVIFSSGIFTGNSWGEEPKPVNLFYMKGVLDKILTQFSLNTSMFENKQSDSNYAELTLSYLYNKRVVCEIGLFSKKILNAFGVKPEVYYLELNLDVLFSILKVDAFNYTPVPKFPSIKGDLSLLIDDNISYLDIQSAIDNIETSFLDHISLFDVYKGDKIDNNKKSYAISFLFQHQDRTLTDVEVDQELIKIYECLVEKFKLSLREGELNLK